MDIASGQHLARCSTSSSAFVWCVFTVTECYLQRQKHRGPPDL